MRIERQCVIDAPREKVWELVSDPEQYPRFMHGITRFDVEGDKDRGLGARYSMRMRVGSADVGGLVEVVEFDEPADMAWTSITGVDQRGRWRLRERDAGRTHVELRLSYGVAGAGLFGSLAERVAAPTVRGHLERTVQQLKRQVEQEQTRRKAAARRAARAGAA
jgi:uncharacterized membrane protein